MTSNLAALNQTIEALTLTDEHAALIQHARTLAALVDEFPHEVKAHTEYREVLKRLMEAGAPQEVDAFAELIAELRRKDSEPETPQTRAGASESRTR